MLVDCPIDIIQTSIEILREAGREGCEGVVLWLGCRNHDHIEVKDAFQPHYTSKADMFHITPEGMNALHDELRRRRCMVAAQVHTHPGRAFHSKADDRWAIVRHVGALSLVLPNFAFDTTADNFLAKARVYCFSDDGLWLAVPRHEVNGSCLTIS